MAKQRFLNNFTSAFIAAVKDAPSSGTPETELDYGVLRISDGAAGSLINPTDGDYYLLTAFKRSGSVESNIEVMRVTGVNNATPGECRITVQRAQEGTSAKAFVAGDYLSLRITKGTAENFSQPADLATKEPVIAAPVSAPTEKYWRGDKTWRDFFTDVRAATLTGLSTATNAVVAATDTVLAAIGKLQAQVSDNLATLTSHTGNTSNPHGVTKAQVGLGNVDNTSDADKPVSTAQANAIALKADASALATWQANPTGVQSLNNGPLGGMRNRIINGCFRVAQRPAAVLANNTSVYGGADRFFSYVGGFTTVSGWTAQQTTLDLAFSSSGFDQFMTLTTTGTGTVNQGTRLESKDVFDLSGKTITVKVNVFQDIGNVPVYLKLSKANAKDDFSAVTPVAQSAGASIPVGGTGTVTLTTTLGAADAANGLQVEVLMLNVGAVTNKNYVIANFSLELGTVATPFEHRHYGQELALCQRYYEEVPYRVDTAIASAAVWGSVFISYKATKRALPTLSHKALNVANCSFNSFQYASLQGCTSVYQTSSATGVATATLVADAEL